MVVHNGDFLGAIGGPSEDNAPLVVDADGVEASQIPAQGLEPVAGRHAEIGELSGAVHLDELSQGHTRDLREAPVPLLVEKLLGVGIGKGLDHGVAWGKRMRPSKSRALFLSRGAQLLGIYADERELEARTTMLEKGAAQCAIHDLASWSATDLFPSEGTSPSARVSETTGDDKT